MLRKLAFLLVICFGISTASGTDVPGGEEQNEINVSSWHKEPFIFDGQLAEEGEFPSQVSVQVNGTHYCGGSVLNERWILTAAKCARESLPEYKVLAGTINLNVGGTKHDVVYIYYHDDYTEFSFDNDIAVMKVYPPFRMGEEVEAVILPKSGQSVPNGTIGTVIGWGEQRYKGPLSDQLMKTNVSVKEYSDCYPWFAAAGHTQLCTIDEYPGACLGDRGGPLFVGNEIVGIISKGNGCEVSFIPTAVYTEISEYIDWIQESIHIW